MPNRFRLLLATAALLLPLATLSSPASAAATQRMSAQNRAAQHHRVAKAPKPRHTLAHRPRRMVRQPA